ncbi:MAG: ATP-dependent metallopeptidase FtsH/Yme1/Tma family protein [Candidatus Obscuribacterales bacterium]|nr:ATP-dependent metallopeptidase FtsH/Yme1/Tma family protein [Candidatus Obscuribacterales bacterium]
MFPKLPKATMNWFLYAAVAFVIIGAVAFVWPHDEDGDDLLKFHSQMDLSRVQQVIRENPATVKTITFVRVKGEAFPGKVLLDSSGEESIWSPLAGEEEYRRISATADSAKIAINSKVVEPSQKTSLVLQLAITIVPWLLFMLVGWLMFSKMSATAQNGSQNKNAKLTRLDLVSKKVSLKDVAGIDDEKRTLEELIFDLKHPELLTSLNGQIPRAVLLKGPPGVGKTYIVQAIAGETGIPVLSGAGSDFVEMYVGVGAARIRDAFAQARRLRDELNSWVIIFIDEFTSIGQNRAEGNNNEHKQTVDQLLVELNGAGDLNERILFIAATNQPEALDAAVTRSGRLGDLVIEISKPDKDGRLAILRVKLENMPIADDVDLEKIANEMTGMTGADIDTLVRKRAPAQAKRRLLRGVSPALLFSEKGFRVSDHFQAGAVKITMDDLWVSLMEMVLGNINETKGRRLDPQLKRMIAYHETGHLTVAMRKLLQNTERWDGQYGDEITDISILGPNGTGGFVRTNPRHDMPTARNLKSRLAVAMAGNVAESLFLGETTGGCQNDVEMANRIIKVMIMQINMSGYHNFRKGESLIKLPAISVKQQGGSRYLGGTMTEAPQYGMSDYSASQVDELIKVYLEEAEAEARAYLHEEREWVEYFVPVLVQKERMRFAEIKEHWDRFHKGKDLSRSFAFVYDWDENHQVPNS